MQPFLLSIIIPMYNTAPYIERCIRSLYPNGLDQSLFEVIVVDDGSTDDGVEKIELLQQEFSNIRLICQENCGVGNARNKGIVSAQGDYLFFVDSDDYVDKESFEELIAEVKGKTYDLYVFEVIQKLSNQRQKTLTRHLLANPSCVNDYAKGLFEIGIYCYLFKRELLISQSLLFDEIPTSEDALFVIRYLLRFSSVYFVRKQVYIYEYRVGSLTKQSNYVEGLIFDRLNMVEILCQSLSSEEFRLIEKRFIYLILETFMIALINNSNRLVYVEIVRQLEKNKLYPFPFKSYGLKYQLFCFVVNRPNLFYWGRGLWRKMIKY